jgi:hypothetical protein
MISRAGLYGLVLYHQWDNKWWLLEEVASRFSQLLPRVKYVFLLSQLLPFYPPVHIADKEQLIMDP